ncbi:hypothetical protein KY290_030815 [Solanum tuberosum]|uniref:Retrotransposon gag domain-containing protein n=1 Tax=Solanum tuberosum TaxID=4113 RepID=A0ABQ7U7D4_SOLTU|nr:hypothetical protein KY290_030815 [Solanum tuberosum]
MVTSWILNSLNREIVDSVAYVDSALELWTDLEDRYDQTNGAKLYQIQKEINDLIQGVLDVTTYYTKMKKLWEELSSLCIKNHCSCACNCGAKDVMHKVEQDRRLIQFLMGLNEIYTIIRGNILMMNPLPSVAQVFALLIQEEKQREFKSNNQLFVESSSLAASSSGCSLAANVSGTSKGQIFQINYSSASPNRRGRPFCDHCKRPSHIKEKCYQLHGYPQNNNRSQKSQSHGQQGYNQFQRQQQYENSSSNQAYRNNNKGKGVAANFVGLSCDSTMEQECGFGGQITNQDIGISKEQYGQLAYLLQQFQAENSGNMQTTSPAVNFACASHHMTFNKLHLTNILPLPEPMLVRLPNGYKVKVTEAPSLKRPLKIGKAHDGLYLICSDCLQKSKHSTSSENPTTCLSLHRIDRSSDNKDNITSVDSNVVTTGDDTD